MQGSCKSCARARRDHRIEIRSREVTMHPRSGSRAGVITAVATTAVARASVARSFAVTDLEYLLRAELEGDIETMLEAVDAATAAGFQLDWREPPPQRPEARRSVVGSNES